MITIWNEPMRVSAHDVDINQVASPSAVLRYMQEAAIMELYRTRPTMEELRTEQHRAFLLSRVSVRISEPLYSYDVITAQSWGCPSKHNSFLRCGQVLKGERVAAQCHSTWALVDLDTRALLRVEQSPFLFGTAPELDLPARLRLPRDLAWESAGTRTVVYGDCDVNCHMNNTHYPDMLCGFLPMMGKTVTDFSVNYMQEAALGETLTVLRAERDGVFYFRTVRESGDTNVEASFRLRDL